MNLDPQSQIGKRLQVLVQVKIFKNSNPKTALDKLKRAVIGLSTEIKNVDSFIGVLYGSQRMPTVYLRLQYGIETSLNKSCWKQLVVALERSENENVLTHILSWAEKFLNQAQVSKSASVNSAPPGTPKSKLLSELTKLSVTPRHRQITWKDRTLQRSVLEVCNDKIIFGLEDGRIQIYSSTNLDCQKELNYSSAKTTSVTCLQCTCTEIIAGYSDGKVGVWGITKKTLVFGLSVANASGDDKDYASCMRWRDPKLVVGTYNGKIHIWQHLMLVGSWDSGEDYVKHIDFNDRYVVFYSCPGPVQVKHLNGNPYRSISSSGDIFCMAFYADRVVTGGKAKIVQVWDIHTGVCLLELKGHEDEIHAVDAHDGVIVSVDDSARIIIWSAKAALEGVQAKLNDFKHPHTNPENEAIDIKLGAQVVAAGSRDYYSRSVVVTDFQG